VLAEARGLVAEARALGYRSLVAEALEAEGEFQDGSDFHPEAVPVLQEAVWTALAVKRDDLAARGATMLTAWVGYYVGTREEGLRWAHLAGALLDRLGPGHDLLRAWLLHGEGNIAMRDYDLEGALVFQREALALKEKVLPPDHPDIAITLAAIAETQHRMGKDSEALATLRRARDIDERAYGASSKNRLQYLSNEAEMLVDLGRAKEAVPLFEAALAGAEAVEPQWPFLAWPLTGLGRAWLALGRPDEARPLLERALRLRPIGQGDVDLAETRFALARALGEDAKERPHARELATQARAAYAHLAAGDGKTKTAASVPAQKQVDAIDAWLTRH